MSVPATPRHWFVHYGHELVHMIKVVVALCLNEWGSNIGLEVGSVVAATAVSCLCYQLKYNVLLCDTP